MEEFPFRRPGRKGRLSDRKETTAGSKGRHLEDPKTRDTRATDGIGHQTLCATDKLIDGCVRCSGNIRMFAPSLSARVAEHQSQKLCTCEVRIRLAFARGEDDERARYEVPLAKSAFQNTVGSCRHVRANCPPRHSGAPRHALPLKVPNHVYGFSGSPKRELWIPSTSLHGAPCTCLHL
eukprot:scaffold2696_cov333-Pavlova_lutheri.AAC.25